MTNTNTDWEKEFIESGAALEHARWARWQNYLHSFLTWNEDLKAWVLPHEKKARWQSQIQTYYGALSEQEKESDRKEVREYLPLVRKEKEKSYQEGVAAENNKLAALVGTALHGIELDAMTLHKLNMLFTPTNTV